MRLPGLKRQRELRCWSISDLARYAGVTRPTAAQADAGQEVSSGTARKVLRALEANPLSETARELHRLTTAEQAGAMAAAEATTDA
jgi:transcriptional regulator with XRE-family HTH domain